MKNNFKTYIIVLLLAMLGGFIGSYGAYSLNNSNPSSNSPSIQTIYSNSETSSLKEGIQKAYDSVVEITSTKVTTDNFFGQQISSTSKGSGVIISEDGYIITNEHVINGATAVEVKDAKGNIYQAKLVGFDAKTDLAVIKVDAKGMTYAEVSDSDALELGDEAIVIGNPLGNGISVSNGIISALNKEVTIENEKMYLIQTNAAVNQGNSGGGLFDIHGNLIGIVNAKSKNTTSEVSVEGLGYAIPSNLVVSIANDLIDNGYVKDRATLGVTVSQINYVQGFPAGLYIVEVSKDSAADKAGLHTYDRIIEFNNRAINNYNELNDELRKLKVGDTTQIKVIRNNEELTFDITLQENIKQN